MIDRLSAAIVETVRRPEIKERFLSLGVEPTGTTPEELAAIMAADTARSAPIVKASGIHRRVAVSCRARGELPVAGRVHLVRRRAPTAVR